MNGRNIVVLLLLASVVAVGYYVSRSSNRSFEETGPASLAPKNLPDATTAGARAAVSDATSYTGVYTTTRLSQVDSAARQPDASIDALMAASYAHDICSMKTRQPASRQGSAGKEIDQESRASVQRIEDFKKTFCVGFIESGPYSKSTIEEFLAKRAGSGDIDAAAVLAGLTVATDGGEAADLTRQKASLERVVQTTSSPSLFFHASQLMLSPAFEEGALGAEEGSALDSESYSEALHFGTLLATCAEFNICSNNSLFLLRTCMPYQCSGGMEGYIKRRIGADQYRQAVSYARALRDQRALETRR